MLFTFPHTVLPQGKLALCACTHRFVTVTDDNKLVASSEKAREREILTVSRSFSVCLFPVMEQSYLRCGDGCVVGVGMGVCVCGCGGEGEGRTSYKLSCNKRPGYDLASTPGRFFANRTLIFARSDV